jgi:hypothetical protein
MFIYNLPPWLYHKRKYLQLTSFISSPKQTGIATEPLIEDMQKLWEHGVNVWDEYKKEHFNLKAIIFCTINDNLTRLSFTGQVKGKIGCVICVDQIESIYLQSLSKLLYMWYQRFFPPKHRYRQWRSSFDGMIKNGEALKHRDGKFVFEMIKNINVIFGKPVKG